MERLAGIFELSGERSRLLENEASGGRSLRFQRADLVAFLPDHSPSSPAMITSFSVFQ